MLTENQDAFGQEIYACFTRQDVFEMIERDDGFVTASAANPASYFSEYPDWPDHYRKAMEYVQGRVLDIGCGAGRISLYLQGQGFTVLGIDNSPLALEVCRQRGLKQTSLTSITQVSRRLGVFDTIILLGNNFGLFASIQRARTLLRRFHGLTSPQARIIAESNDIYATTDPIHLAYHERNRRRGRMAGQIRFRVRFRQFKSPWIDYLMVSKAEMASILEGTGWHVEGFLDNPAGPQYIAILEKDRDQSSAKSDR